MADITLTDVLEHEDFIFALCTFVDEFKRTSDKYKMIACPPLTSEAESENLCMLAGAAHKLANDYGIPIPDWISDPKYIMPYPVFASNTKNEEYQQYLVEDTPYEFSSKNMYVGSNAIDRV